MSSGRKYSQATELSTEDHLADLDRKYDTMRERIQVYDELIKKFEALKKTQEEFSKKPQELDNKIKDLEAQGKETFFKHKTVIDRHSDQYAFIITKFKDFEDARDRGAVSFHSCIDELQKKLQDIANKAPTYSSKKLDSVEFEEFKMLHSSQMNHFQEVVRRLMTKVEDYEKGLEAIVESIQEVNRLGETQGSSITKLTGMVNGIHSNISAKITDQAALQDKSYIAFKEQVALMMTAMKQEIIGTPSSNASIEARIINRLEMATLDGSNAVTMARNGEQKLKLLEKKVEALTAQLAKYELK